MPNLNDITYIEELSLKNFTDKRDVNWDRGDNAYLLLGSCFYCCEVLDLSKLDIDTIYVCQGCNFDNVILPDNFILDKDNTNKLIKEFEDGLYKVDLNGEKVQLISSFEQAVE